MPGYAAALAALTDAELRTMLERRPDLRAGQPPGSFPELASRAGGPASIAAACAGLDAGTLQLAELLALLGLPATIEQVAHAAGPGLSDAELERRLAGLAAIGLALPEPDGTIAGPAGLAAGFDRPGRLGPSVADLAKVGVSREQLATAAANLGSAPSEPGASKPELVKAVAAALSEPAVVSATLRAASPAARSLLDKARNADAPITVWTAGPARNAGAPDAEPADWLVARALLLPATYNQFVVPREAELGLRGGWIFPDWPGPPELATGTALPGAAHTAAGAAQRLTLAAETLITELDAAPLELIRTGTVAVRDLRRVARTLELTDAETGFLLDLAVAAGILVPGGPWGSRSLGLATKADAWLSASRAERWAALAVAWRDAPTALEEHLAAADGPPRSADDQPRPLALPATARAAERRRAVLDALDGVPAGEGVAADGIETLLAWRRPLLWGSAGDQTRAVLRAAALLGVAVAERGRAAPGLQLGPLLAGAGVPELAEAAADALPDGAREFLVAGDLTVVAPGGLAPDLAARLGTMADRAGTGTSASWRLDVTSLQRAFDAGSSAAEVLEFLGEHSRTPLPQALEYLAADAERQHGRLRVGGASTYLRGEPAIVTGLVRSTAGRKLGLRELAPGVAVTGKAQRDVLAALRKAGESPVAEAPDGTPRDETPRPVRHPARPVTGHALRASEPVASVPPDELVARLRAAGGSARRSEPDPDEPSPLTVPVGNGVVQAPAEIAELCQQAAEAQTVVEIAYDGLNGATVRAIEPLRVQAGRVSAWCRLRQAERTFVLSRIAWARPHTVPARGGVRG